MSHTIGHIDIVNETVCTVPQLAKHLRISKAQAWRLILRGKIESFLIESSRRTSYEAAQRYVDKKNAKQSQ